ncbi:triacylglycerol lipase [Methylomarinovum tepidoasis]|uniref:Triacylglycerol lipase n=1 Tax=Methylomarinovum tepidoasis TaxID=2840183 RepID=A0AAU9CRF4_9GAMM|nr:lipase family protein [Methylomarinovum sp. IN45]BCX88968.1 triacylglycerol lipase [Methylomarinovum sp. IN45]
MGSFLDFDPNATGYHGRNALALGLAADLAYETRPKVLDTLDRWGFPQTQWLDKNGTQGYLAANDHMVLIAFRGTEPHDLRDILTDVNVVLTPGPVGQVHYGFLRALNGVWEPIEQWLQSVYRDQPIWLCGHSLGAALATLATARLAFDPAFDFRLQGLYTFGSPRVGNEVFADRFNQRCRRITFRFRNNNDVVTRVPVPGIFGWDYRHVGRLCHFDARGRLRFSMSWWEMLLDRLRGHLDDLGKPGTDGMKDHAMTAYLRCLRQNVNVTP